MAGRTLPANGGRFYCVQAEDVPPCDGLKLLADHEYCVESALPPRRDVEFSDTDDFLDVAQALQEAEVRERLRSIIEGNRGSARSRRTTSGRARLDTVASLRHSMSREKEPKVKALSSVSESSSETPRDDLSHALFMSAAARDHPSEVCSSRGAPASREDNLSVFLEDGSEERLSTAGQERTASLPNDLYATKDELAAVLACLRRVERKVDWLMSQERRMKLLDPAALMAPVPSLPELFYYHVWVRVKATARCAWFLRGFCPLLDWVEIWAIDMSK